MFRNVGIVRSLSIGPSIGSIIVRKRIHGPEKCYISDNTLQEARSKRYAISSSAISSNGSSTHLVDRWGVHLPLPSSVLLLNVPRCLALQVPPASPHILEFQLCSES